MSGLQLLHVAKDANGDYQASAHAAPGVATHRPHEPFLYIPSSAIKNSTMLAPVRGASPLTDRFGLRSLAVPGGKMLTEVSVSGCDVQIIGASGAVSFDGSAPATP